MKQERTWSHTTDALPQSFPLSGLKSVVYQTSVLHTQTHTHTYISLHIFPSSITAVDSWTVSSPPPLEAQQHLVLITVNNNRCVCITGCQVSWEGCRKHWSLTHFPVLWTPLILPGRCLRGWRSAKWTHWSLYTAQWLELEVLISPSWQVWLYRRKNITQRQFIWVQKCTTF